MNRCEDYPCCGHTDGLPCDWTYTEQARAFDALHFACDHENGYCDAAWDDDEVPEQDDSCMDPYIMEDQWLDGSYEE